MASSVPSSSVSPSAPSKVEVPTEKKTPAPLAPTAAPVATGAAPSPTPSSAAPSSAPSAASTSASTTTQRASSSSSIQRKGSGKSTIFTKPKYQPASLPSQKQLPRSSSSLVNQQDGGIWSQQSSASSYVRPAYSDERYGYEDYDDDYLDQYDRQVSGVQAQQSANPRYARSQTSSAQYWTPGQWAQYYRQMQYQQQQQQAHPPRASSGGYSSRYDNPNAGYYEEDDQDEELDQSPSGYNYGQTGYYSSYSSPSQTRYNSSSQARYSSPSQTGYGNQRAYHNQSQTGYRSSSQTSYKDEYDYPAQSPYQQYQQPQAPSGYQRSVYVSAPAAQTYAYAYQTVYPAYGNTAPATNWTQPPAARQYANQYGSGGQAYNYSTTTLRGYNGATGQQQYTTTGRTSLAGPPPSYSQLVAAQFAAARAYWPAPPPTGAARSNWPSSPSSSASSYPPTGGGSYERY